MPKPIELERPKLSRPRPRKVEDDSILLEVARLTEIVTVGPTVRELQDSVSLSASNAYIRAKQLVSVGMLRLGYRGFILTDEGRKRVDALLAEDE